MAVLAASGCWFGEACAGCSEQSAQMMLVGACLGNVVSKVRPHQATIHTCWPKTDVSMALKPNMTMTIGNRKATSCRGITTSRAAALQQQEAKLTELTDYLISSHEELDTVLDTVLDAEIA